jgi:hypothetical protein
MTDVVVRGSIKGEYPYKAPVFRSKYIRYLAYCAVHSRAVWMAAF